MVAAMKKLLKRLDTEDDQADGVFSIFEKWLDEDEAYEALMSYCNVVSFDEYDRIKKIERQYLELVVDLSRTNEVQLLQHKRRRPENDTASFNDVYSAVSRYVNHDKSFDIYLRDLEALVAFGYDFTAYLYVSDINVVHKVRSVFLRNGFHELT